MALRAFLHPDAPRCTEMHRDAPRRLYFFYNNFWIAPSATKMIFFALFSSYLHCDALRWLYFFYDNFWIAPNATELIFIALLSSYLHSDAPWCTELHRDAPRWLY